MIFTQMLNLETGDQDTLINPYYKFLRVNVHKDGLHFYLPLEEDVSKRKVSDIIKLAYKFYNSPVDYIYLITLPYDNIKKRAHNIYMARGEVVWKDLVSPCKFKELVIDCCHERAIELVLSKLEDL